MKTTNPVLVENLEGRRLMCANLGEGVSAVARSQPGAQAELTQFSIEFSRTAGINFGRDVVAVTAQHPETFPGCTP